MKYPGGKGIAYPHIINLIPPHDVYIETHLGGGAVMRKKKASKVQIGIEIDLSVVNKWKSDHSNECSLIHGDAIEVLDNMTLDENTVIYVDPPYLPETRRRKKVYKYDYTEKEHVSLLAFLLTLPCKVLISGYPSSLYDQMLKGWNIHTFEAKSHTELREECIWYNFPTPTELHDNRFIGNNFREREKVKRRQSNLKRKINDLPIQEKNALYQWLHNEISEVTV
jgi:DNA adenine methylase